MPQLASFQGELALVLMCAGFVRLWGWKAGGVKGWLLAALLALGFYVLLPSPYAPALTSALLAILVFVWRDLPRNTGGMAIAPENNRVPETLAFNMLMLGPVFVVRALAYDVTSGRAAVAWLALSVACTALAYLNHILEPWAARRAGRDPCLFTDLACGAALGLAFV